MSEKTFVDYGLPTVPVEEFYTKRINTTTFIFWNPKDHPFYKEVMDAIVAYNYAYDKKMGYKNIHWSDEFRSPHGYKDKKTALKSPGYLVEWIHECGMRYVDGYYNLDKLNAQTKEEVRAKDN